MADNIYSLAEAYGDREGPGFSLAPSQPVQPHQIQRETSAQGGNLEALLAMLKQPAAQSRESSVYAPQLQEAMGRQKANEEAFNQMIQAAMQRKEESGPSKAEMYFRLAAAFGTPTKTGNFFESLGQAGATAGQIEKERREAGSGDRDKLLQLGMLKHKMALESSKDETNVLRQLTGQEMADRRAAAQADAIDKRTLALKAYEAFLNSGKPQSEAGKYAADQGFKPGTPEFARAAEGYFRTKMENGDYFKQMALSMQQANLGIAQQGLELRQQAQLATQAEKAKLTPQELKLKNETETALNVLKDSYNDITKALKLNPNTYDTSIPDMLEYKAKSLAGSEDPRVVNTGELSNILNQGALSTASTTLKTQISDADIKMLQGLQGADAKSKEERKRILENAKGRMIENYKLKKKQLEDINAGRYRATTQALPDSLE